MVTLALSLSLFATSLNAPSGELRLHADVIRHAPVDAADLDRAREVATLLLESAGIVLDWRDCDAVAACPRGSNGVVSIDVRLVPTPRPGHDDACGDVVWGPRSRLPTILVYLRTIDEKVRKFRLGPIGRSNPSMSTLQRGDLIGVTVAHEIGHALGLRHAARRVMKSDLDTDDMLAIRQSRFMFLKSEHVHMHDALEAVRHELPTTDAKHN